MVAIRKTDAPERVSLQRVYGRPKGPIRKAADLILDAGSLVSQADDGYERIYGADAHSDSFREQARGWMNVARQRLAMSDSAGADKAMRNALLANDWSARHDQNQDALTKDNHKTTRAIRKPLHGAYQFLDAAGARWDDTQRKTFTFRGVPVTAPGGQALWSLDFGEPPYLATPEELLAVSDDMRALALGRKAAA